MKIAAVAASVALSALAALPAGAQVAGFPDVPKNHWAADSVAHLATAGIITKGSPKPLGASSAMTASAPAKSKPAPVVYDGNKPVTRYELAVTLYRFVQYIEHANAQGKTKFGADALPADGPTALKRLIAEGYLPATTPLAKDGEKPVTANQMADALAAVITKSREKTTPLSPDLKTPIEKPQSAPKG